MRRTGPILRQQKDTCSCWVCRDKKFRATRKTEKSKAITEELNQGINDDGIIFDLQMAATYPHYKRKHAKSKEEIMITDLI